MLTFILKISTTFDYKQFIDQELNITLSKYENYKLAENIQELDTSIFVSINKTYKYTTQYNSIAQITKVNSQYYIKIGSYYLCRENDYLIKCNDNIEYWDIKESLFGFTISNNNICITVENELKLRTCTGSGTQVFYFYVIPPILQCIRQLGSLKKKPTTMDEKRIKNMVNGMLKEVRNDDEIDEIIDSLEEEVEELKNGDLTVENVAPGIKRNGELDRALQKMRKETVDRSWWDKLWGWLKNLFCP